MFPTVRFRLNYGRLWDAQAVMPVAAERVRKHKSGAEEQIMKTYSAFEVDHHRRGDK